MLILRYWLVQVWKLNYLFSVQWIPGFICYCSSVQPERSARIYMYMIVWPESRVQPSQYYKEEEKLFKYMCDPSLSILHLPHRKILLGNIHNLQELQERHFFLSGLDNADFSRICVVMDGHEPLITHTGPRSPEKKKHSVILPSIQSDQSQTVVT